MSQHLHLTCIQIYFYEPFTVVWYGVWYLLVLIMGFLTLNMNHLCYVGFIELDKWCCWWVCPQLELS